MINAIHEWIVKRRESIERQREYAALVDELEQLTYHAARAAGPDAYLRFATRIDVCHQRIAALRPSKAPIESDEDQATGQPSPVPPPRGTR